MNNVVSGYSFLSAIILLSTSLLVISLLRRRTNFLVRHGVSALLLAAALAFLRLVVPLDLPFIRVIQSWVIMPAVRSFFLEHLWILWLLLSVWGAGAAVVLLRDGLSLVRAQNICQSYRVVTNPRVDAIAAGLKISCPVVVSPDVGIPYVAGVFRHTIYLPDLDLSDRETALVLTHEYQHIRSHDSQIKLAWSLLSALLWWNLLVYKFREELDVLLELRCDAKVTASMDAAGRMQYLEMLLHMMKWSVGGPKPPALSLHESGALNAPSAVQQRFLVVMNSAGQKPGRAGWAVKCALVALFLASYLVAVQPAGLPEAPEGEIHLQLEGGEEVYSRDEKTADQIAQACIVNENGRYYLYIQGRQAKELTPEEVASDSYKDYIILEDCFS